MGDGGWQLSAPATSLLLSLPAAGANPQAADAGPAPVRLALQELLARGALTLSVVRDGVMLTEVTLGPGQDPGDLAPALVRLRKSLLPLLPGPLKEVMPKAHRRNPVMTSDLRRDARDELVAGQLIQEQPIRRLGRTKGSGWTRTAAGDGLTEDGSRFLERLREQQDEIDKDSDGGFAALLDADSAAAPQWEEIELEGGNRGGWGDFGDGGGD